ncbi:MAG TPA: HTH domain-containing protein [Lacipirellulaceae bacterium]|nr:HTH domain-containing protein [Lacipirellulaceae bacterium]
MSNTAKKPATRKGTKSAKADTKASANGKAKAKKLSALDAAAKVLASAKAPMTTKEMIKAMASKKLWSSPDGKTPHATLYSAILREVNTKGKNARFKKTERGKFVANG